MIVLGLSVVLMFSVSVAALATSKSLQESFLLNTWIRLSDEKKRSVQDSLDCCGFNEISQNNTGSDEHPSCATEELQKDGVIIPLREREREREGRRIMTARLAVVSLQTL